MHILEDAIAIIAINRPEELNAINVDVITELSSAIDTVSADGPSYFHTFRLLELITNSSILAGRSAYTLIGTYELPSLGLQKLMEIGTIIGDKAYSVQ